MPYAKITYLPVENAEDAEWCDKKHLMEVWKFLEKRQDDADHVLCWIVGTKKTGRLLRPHRAVWSWDRHP